MSKHTMDDTTGFEATDEEMGLKPSEPTPGPWYVKRALHQTDGGWDYGIAGKVDGTNFCIAEAFEVVGNGVKAPAEANARLIAAAPEMLGALKVYLDLFDVMASGTGVDQIALACARAGMRAAIAKAEGRA